MQANKSQSEIEVCQEIWSKSTSKPSPYADSDYTETPHITQSVVWNKDGYAVLIRSTKNDEPRTWLAASLVQESGTWKVQESKTGVDEPSSDLCSILGGECG